MQLQRLEAIIIVTRPVKIVHICKMGIIFLMYVLYADMPGLYRLSHNLSNY